MRKFFSNLQGYRTLILNGVVLLLAVSSSQLPISREDVEAVLVSLATVGNIILRVYTTTPIGTKPSEEAASTV
jgi:hypothetical protein